MTALQIQFHAFVFEHVLEGNCQFELGAWDHICFRFSHVRIRYACFQPGNSMDLNFYSSIYHSTRKSHFGSIEEKIM